MIIVFAVVLLVCKYCRDKLCQPSFKLNSESSAGSKHSEYICKMKPMSIKLNADKKKSSITRGTVQSQSIAGKKNSHVTSPVDDNAESKVN